MQSSRRSHKSHYSETQDERQWFSKATTGISLTGHAKKKVLALFGQNRGAFFIAQFQEELCP